MAQFQDLVLDNGVVLHFNSAGQRCWNTYQVFDLLQNGEYTVYNLVYYAKVNQKVYCHRGNWYSAHSTKSGEWKKVHG